MTYPFNANLDKFAKYHKKGIYILPDGRIFNTPGYANSSHCSGILHRFFYTLLYPNIDEFRFMEFSKEYIINLLMEQKKDLLNRINNLNWLDDVPEKAKIMKMYLIAYFINCYKSSHTTLNSSELRNKYSTLENVIGHSLDNQGYNGYMMMKEIFVQSSNCDSLETYPSKTITTSKRNIYETYYDYILNDYSISQVPKIIYDEKSEKYIQVPLASEFLNSDKENRLKDELLAIKESVPLQKRMQFRRADYNRNKRYYLSE